jgi:ornithine carbamoyltransferase
MQKMSATLPHPLPPLEALERRSPGHLKGRSLLRIADWNAEDLLAVLDLAADLKAAQARFEPHPLLPGRAVGMIFDKPSTRTRVSFEVGVAQLGGTALYLAGRDLQLGRGETIRDTAKVLSRYLNAIVIRISSQATVDELAAEADVPVVNALTDLAHPCQALADVMTIRERLGRLEGVRIAWVGDGNNVCASLLEASLAFGASPVVACPAGYEPAVAGVEIVRDPVEAVRDADVVVTDVWTSMGFEDEAERRRADLAPYALDEELFAQAPSGAFAMHCLPAHYGEEISEAVAHGPRSAVWDEAENRLHVQKALLALIVR